MNCEHFEELLPAYAENELEGRDKARVDAHLEGCESCRESLAFFAQLEESLSTRRTLRPSDSIAAKRITRRVGFRREWRFVPAFISLRGLPTILSGSLIAVGIIAFLARASVQEFFSNLGTIRFKGDLGRRLSEALSPGLDAAAAGSELTWAIAYLGVFALILLAGSWMVLRHIRD